MIDRYFGRVSDVNGGGLVNVLIRPNWTVPARGLSNIGDADDPWCNRGLMALAGFEFTLGG